jgi:MFS family permease
MKVLTQQAHVPWSWVVIALLPWTAVTITQFVNVLGLTFTLKKFTDDPVVISLITGSQQGFALIVGALVAFASDRIWTRWGRRKPILLTGWIFSGLFILLVPFASNLSTVVLCILLYVFFIDMNGPYEVATMEVIPSRQRGRAGAITQILKMGASLLFFSVLIAHFDARFQFLGITITGEQVMYGTVAAFLVGCAIIYGVCIEEVRPPDAEVYPLRELPFRSFFKEVFSPDVMPLYGLMFAMQTFWLSTLQFEALLVTEQWGYSKADYGAIMSIGTIATVVLVPFGGWLSDRRDRLQLTKWGLIAVVSLKVVYYVYCEYITPGGVPPFAGALMLGLFRLAVGGFLAVACVPLIFDLLDTNRFGTFACGNLMVMSFVTFVGSNAMGLWVKFSAGAVYGLPAGTYNYMAAFHWLFLVGVLGIAYLFVFERRFARRLFAAKAERERLRPRVDMGA